MPQSGRPTNGRQSTEEPVYGDLAYVMTSRLVRRKSGQIQDKYRIESSGPPPLANSMSPYFDFIDGANLQQPTYLATGSTNPAGYSSPNAPLARQSPSRHINVVLDPRLLQKMQGSLRSYLTTKCGVRLVSIRLVARLDLDRQSLAGSLPNLTGETASAARYFFVTNVAPLIRDFVFDVDHTVIELEKAPTGYIWGRRVHVEFKSPRALLRHAPEIFNLGKANGGKGSALVLGQRETGGRSLLYKVFLPISLFSTAPQRLVRLV